MKIKFIPRLIVLAIICLFISTKLQAQFRIDAQYRPRAELWDGYGKLSSNNTTPTLFISQRTRLSLQYEIENLKIRFTPQDVRVWGDEELSSSTGVFGDKASLDLFEAYVEIKAGKIGWISVGRQQLVYDQERMLGSRNWNQYGLSYDAAILKSKVGPWNIHAGASWNSYDAGLINNLYSHQRIKSLNFLWANRNFNKKLNLSFLHIASGVTQTDSTNSLYFKQTTGIYIDFKSNGFSSKGNIYYQYGKNNTGTNVNAFLLDDDVAYTIGKLKPGLGLSYLSGNNNPSGNSDKLFDVLYGARHRYFGYMDYYRDFAKHSRQGGLTDLYSYVEYSISESLALTSLFHYFQLAQTNEMIPENKNLGFESDWMLSYNFNGWGTIKSGYAFYLPSDSFKILQAVPDNKFSQFFYLELTIKTNLFKQETKSL